MRRERQEAMQIIGKRLRSLSLFVGVAVVAVVSTNFLPHATNVGAGPTSSSTSTSSTTSPTTTTVASSLRVAPDATGRYTVLEIGDSLGIDLGWGLRAQLARSPKVSLIEGAQGSTGLSNDWYYPWPPHFSQLLRQHHPQVAVIFLGTNDEQAIHVGSTVCLFNTPCWRSAYAHRVRQMLALANSAGTKVLWVGSPPMGAPAFSTAMSAINAVVQREVATHRNALYVSSAPLAAVGGRYRASAIINNQVQVIREPDGIHINTTGSQLLALFVLRTLSQQFGVPSTPAIGMALR